MVLQQDVQIQQHVEIVCSGGREYGFLGAKRAGICEPISQRRFAFQRQGIGQTLEEFEKVDNHPIQKIQAMVKEILG